MSRADPGSSAPDADTVSMAAADRRVRRASLVAGVGLLLMAGLGVFGYFLVLGGLVTEGDATRTAADVLDAEGTFRAGVAALFAVAVLDVIVSWALYAVFEPASRELSRLAAWFRVAYAGVFVVAISHLVRALAVLTDAGYLAAFTAEQRHAQAMLAIDTFYAIWSAGLILFGVHLLLVGYLAYRAGYVPSVLGVLVAIAGLGYLADSVGPVLSPGYAIELGLFTFWGELALLVWLLVWGRRISVTATGTVRA